MKVLSREQIWSNRKEKKGIYVEEPSPIDLEYRRKVSNMNDEYTLKYLEKFADDMKYRFYSNIKNMTDDDIILFAVKFLSADNEYRYYYIYNDDEVIGEIYSFKQFNGFFFNIYMEEKYRNEENLLKALEAYKNCAFGFPNETRQIGLDIEDKFLEDILLKSGFKIDAEFASGEKRFYFYEYDYDETSIKKPTIEDEKLFNNYLERNKHSIFQKLNYKKWLKHIEKVKNKKQIYLLMIYNERISDYEVLGVGVVNKNWKKENCINFEIDRSRGDTLARDYFRLLLNELDKEAEYITLSCNVYDKIKQNAILQTFDFKPEIRYCRRKIYYTYTLIVY